MPKFIWIKGEGWVDREEFVRPEPVAPAVWGDLPEYVSPLSMRPVDGRRARREEMARFNVREVDPGERMDGDRKEMSLAREEKKYLDTRAAETPFELSDQARDRLLKP